MFIGQAAPFEAGNADEPLLEIAAQRSRPKLMILDEELKVAFFERGTPAGSAARLRERVESAVRDAVEAWHRDASPEEHVAVLDENTVVRVSRMSGNGGTFIAVLIEEESRRAKSTG